MRKSLPSLFLLVLVTAVLGLTPGNAQEHTGVITGNVRDRAQGVLPGARAELSNAGTSAVSNGQGQFTFLQVFPGKYMLTVTYVGFKLFSAEVTVTAGQTAHVDATMEIAAQNEVVTVRGDRQHGEVEALNIERTADNIVQVLPAEVITSLPIQILRMR